MARTRRLNLEALEDRYNPSAVWGPDANNLEVFDQKVTDSSTSSIVFVDAELLSKVPSAEWEGSTLVPLYHDKDFVHQITVGLSSGGKWDVIRLITHGSDGAIHLGKQEINESTLVNRSSELGEWNQFLSRGADFLIYGCNVAATEAGLGFVNHFAQVVHADMAASSDITGIKGNLRLECSTGLITNFILGNIQEWNKNKIALPQFGDFIYDTIYYSNRFGLSFTIAITGYTGQGGSVVIPESIGTNYIQGIGKDAFKGNNKITDIKILGNYKIFNYIDDNAFMDCVNLRTFQNNKTTNVGFYAFSNCTSLQTIDLSNAEYIGSYAFHNCSTLKNIVLDSLKITFDFTCELSFYGCTGIQSFSVASTNRFYSVNEQGYLCNKDMTEIFQCPGDLTGIAVIDSKIKYIYTNAFKWSKKISFFSVSIQNTNYNSDLNGILYYKNSLLKVPNGKTGKISPRLDTIYISESSFSECNMITDVVLPEKVTKIGYNAFRGCKSLTSIYLPNSIDEIGEYAFAECENLKNIILPKNLNTIEQYVFYRCYKLTTITFQEETVGKYVYVGFIRDYAFNNCTSLSTFIFYSIPPSIENPVNALFFPYKTPILSIFYDYKYDWAWNKNSSLTRDLNRIGQYNFVPFNVPTSLNLELSTSNSIYGDLVTFTSVITAGTVNPSGVVKFFDNGNELGSSNIINGKATFSIAILKHGNHAITSSFSNIPLFLDSTSLPKLLTVARKNITVAGLTVANKIYDKSDFAYIDNSSTTLSGLIPGDLVSLEGQPTGRFASPDVGTYDVLISGFSISGPDSSNYNFANPIITAKIFQKELTISGITGIDKIYDGTYDASIITYNIQVIGAIFDDVFYISGIPYGIFTSNDAGVNDIIVRGLEITGLNLKNYTFNPATFATIHKKNAYIINALALDKIYDGNDKSIIDYSQASLSEIVSGDLVGLSGSPQGIFDSVDVGHHFVTISGFEISGSKGKNYNLIQPTSFANIVSKDLTIVDTFANDKIYDGTNFAIVSNIYSSLIGVVSGDSVSLSGTPTGIFDSPHVGKRDVSISGFTLSGANAGNYNLVQPRTSANIVPKELTISGTTANNKIYDGTNNASINTEYSVLNGIVPGDSLNLSKTTIAKFESPNVGNNNVFIEGFDIAGTSSSNYIITQPVAQATIFVKELAVSGVSALNKVYDGKTTVSLITTDSFLVGIIAGDDVNLVNDAVGTFSSANIGKHNISVAGFSVSGTKSSNYAVVQPSTEASITAKSLTITANDHSKIYGENLPVFSAQFDGLVEGDTFAAIGGLNLFTSAKASSIVGTYPIIVSVEDPGNYLITLIDGTLKVTKANLKIIADDKSKIYGSNLPEFTTTVSGLVNGDTSLSISGLGVTTTATVSSIVGNYPLKPTGTNSNYDITLVDGNLSVTKAALVILADNKTKVYGSILPLFTTTVSGLVNGDGASSILDLGVTTSATSSSTVGTYTLKPKGTNANYDISLIEGSLLITRAQLTITAENKSKIYGNTLPTLTATYSGLVNGDSPAAISGLALTTTALASSNIGTYPISTANATSPNYSITLANGTLTVIKATLVITADLKTKIYGQPMPELTTRVAGLVNGDTRDLISGLGVETVASASSPVGSYDLIPTGSNPNYSITYNKALILVTRAPLTITGPTLTKIYGDKVPTLVPTVSGLVNGDTPSKITGLEAISQVLAGSSVGSYTVTVTGTNPNYDITKIDGSILVTPAKISIRAENKSFIRGLEPIPAFTYTLSGLVNGDTANQIGGAPILSSPAKQYSPFGTYPIHVDVSKLTNSNYSFEGLNGTLSINKVATSIIPVASIPILTTTNGAANGITIWGAGGKKLGSLNPYPGYTGRIVTALGDLNGDGVFDIITGVGAGTSPLLRRFDGRTLKEIGQGLYAYDQAFLGGMSVAAADVDGDGLYEIITGTGNGSAPHVKVRKMDGTIISSFYAYAPEFTRGVNLITGDIDNDGKSEIVSTPNWGGGPHVKVFDGKGKASASFFAYESNFIGGFSLALADTDGNGIKELVTESYAGRITSGRVFDTKGKMLKEWFPHGTISSGGMVIAADLNGDKMDEIVSVPLAGTQSVLKVFDGGLKQTASVLPYPASYTKGISIKAVDLNGDGIKEIATAPKAGLPPQVRRFDGKLKVLDSLFATATSFTGGIWLE